MPGISTWRDLKVWQKAHELTLLTYKVTKQFPSDEKFGLSSQMRRAAVSVASNIVEGFHRRTVRESLNFYNMAGGSLEELRYQYVLSSDLGYVSRDMYAHAEKVAEEVSKMLMAWVLSQRSHISQS